MLAISLVLIVCVSALGLQYTPEDDTKVLRLVHAVRNSNFQICYHSVSCCPKYGVSVFFFFFLDERFSIDHFLN